MKTNLPTRRSRQSAAPKPGRDTPPEFELTEWPFYWLSRVVARYLERLEVALKPEGLDVARWRVLMSLHGQDKASVSEIAEHAIVKLPTMTKIVQRMQADGLVECRPRVTDARVTEVVLTARGQAAREAAWRAATGIYEDVFGHIPPTKIKQLNALLQQVFRNLD